MELENAFINNKKNYFFNVQKKQVQFLQQELQTSSHKTKCFTFLNIVTFIGCAAGLIIQVSLHSLIAKLHFFYPRAKL
jgi:hypothetical protein